MKKTNLLLSLAALLAAVSPGVASESAPEKVTTSDGRVLNLTWHDEFDVEGLPNADYWNYEVGYIRNYEKQYYTDARLENVFIKDGLLTIRTIKEDYDIASKPKNHDETTAAYTSGSIETLGKASWQYGRVEVRAKLPKGKGIWPAIWMMGDNIMTAGYPECGEIDVMEYVGHTPHRAWGTIHMQRKDAPRDQVVSRGDSILLDKEGEEPEETFHVYALEWTKDFLKIFVDDHLILDFQRSEEEAKTPEWPFDQKCYIKLNTALGGSWGGEVAEGTCPTDFQIDYVRVYQ